jgi:hypothetical protein
MPSTASLDDKKAYLDSLLARMSLEELGECADFPGAQSKQSISAFQLPLISGNWIIGEKSDHEGLGISTPTFA